MKKIILTIVIILIAGVAIYFFADFKKSGSQEDKSFLDDNRKEVQANHEIENDNIEGEEIINDKTEKNLDEQTQLRYDTCTQNSEGDLCTLTTPIGEKQGTCKIEQDLLLCTTQWGGGPLR